MSHHIVNSIPTRVGDKAHAVCEFCDRRSRPIRLALDGQPSLSDFPRGWSVAPFPAHFRHGDGSTGGRFTCPPCSRLLSSGARLPVSEARQAARRSRSASDARQESDGNTLIVPKYVNNGAEVDKWGE